MQNKFSKLVIFLLSFLSASVFATETNKILTLKIEFNSKANGTISDHPIHINKTIKIDTGQESNTIIMTESIIEHNFPVTVTMLVKPVEVSKNQVDLRFNLLQYGFNQRGSVITQPHFVLVNGEWAEMKNDQYKLKVKAKWS